MKIKFTKNKHLKSATGGGNIFREGREIKIVDGMVVGNLVNYIIDEPISNFAEIIKEEEKEEKEEKYLNITELLRKILVTEIQDKDFWLLNFNRYNHNTDIKISKETGKKILSVKRALISMKEKDEFEKEGKYLNGVVMGLDEFLKMVS